MKKSIFKSRTFWVNLVMAIISLAVGLETIEGVSFPIWLMPVIILVCNIFLRFITDTAVGWTDKKAKQ